MTTTDTTTATTTDSPVSPVTEANTTSPLGGAFAVDAQKVQSHLDRVVRETVGGVAQRPSRRRGGRVVRGEVVRPLARPADTRAGSYMSVFEVPEQS